MTLFLGIVSQKGGVGKSTLARLIAKEFATAGWRVKIAALDIAQGTSFNWQARRLQHALEPTIPVERFGTVEQAARALLKDSGITVEEVAHRLRVSPATLYRHFPGGRSGLDEVSS